VSRWKQAGHARAEVPPGGAEEGLAELGGERLREVDLAKSFFCVCFRWVLRKKRAGGGQTEKEKEGFLVFNRLSASLSL
jgi:hypothetical protein